MRECNAAKKSVFLVGSLKGIGYEGLDVNTVFLPAKIQAVIKIAINPVNHPCAKHIDIQYHKILKLISNNLLKLNYISTEWMGADELTKPLIFTKHKYFITMLGLGNKETKVISSWPPTNLNGVDGHQVSVAILLNVGCESYDAVYLLYKCGFSQA